ncbi:MAG: DeoR/GlpR family DNA-binding transcription regulator [Verrucomicrobiota bacterium]
MQPEERQSRIEDYLQKVEFASLDELSELVDASPSTVRRDLSLLETKGSVQRTHGGARVINPRSDEFTFSSRDTHQLAEKEAIGRAVVELIKPNESVILDAGTTVYHAAKYLESRTPHIITNSLPVANHFASATRVEVIISGGVIYPRLGVLVGPLAVESFKQMHADVAIMSAGGITPEGITNSHGLLIDIQRAMIQAAQRVIFCIDSTKFGRQSVSHLCSLDDIDIVVTDHKAPAEVVAGLRAKGVEVILATV